MKIPEKKNNFFSLNKPNLARLLLSLSLSLSHSYRYLQLFLFFNIWNRADLRQGGEPTFLFSPGIRLWGAMP
jgi:hypothetical protein